MDSVLVGVSSRFAGDLDPKAFGDGLDFRGGVAGQGRRFVSTSRLGRSVILVKERAL